MTLAHTGFTITSGKPFCTLRKRTMSNPRVGGRQIIGHPDLRFARIRPVDEMKAGSMRLPSLLIAVLIAAGLYWWFAVRPASEPLPDPVTKAPEETRDAPVPVMVLESVAQERSDALILRGRTAASRSVDVPAETQGRVISQPIRAGARVEKGQLLCELDPGARPAQLAEAKAKLAEARTESTAATTLSSKGFAAETTRIAREAQLEAAQAAVDLVELDIERLQIFAPFSGLLETDTAELGSLLQPGQVCATVIDLSDVKVEGFVSETTVDKLSVGAEATARLVNGREARGEITFISRMADPETRTFEVEVTLPNPDGAIRDGMTAEIAVPLPAETAHLIPQSALTLDDDGRLGVRIAEGKTTRFVPVEILSDERQGVWVSGLPERAEVLVVGQEFVTDGRTIAPTRVGWDDLS